MKKSIIFIFLLMTSCYLFSQEATTNDGKKVLLNSDGTWKYIESSQNTTVVDSDCSNYIRTDTDKMTGKSSISSKSTLIISSDGGKNGLGIYVMNIKESLALSIQAVGAGNCIDKGSTINILFRDGTKMQLSNANKFNCEGKTTLYFGGVFGKKDELKNLQTKEIETMRVWTSKSFVEKDFTAEQSRELMQTINCLLK
jgi:hypothetical protein